MEEVFPAFGAKRRSFDLRCGDSCAHQLLQISGSQIQVRFRSAFASFDRCGKIERVCNILTDFVTTHTNMRSDRDPELICFHLILFDEPTDCATRNTGSSPAPAGVNGAYGPSVNIRDEDR